jgi:hypothetical protein
MLVWQHLDDDSEKFFKKCLDDLLDQQMDKQIIEEIFLEKCKMVAEIKMTDFPDFSGSSGKAEISLKKPIIAPIF